MNTILKGARGGLSKSDDGPRSDQRSARKNTRIEYQVDEHIVEIGTAPLALDRTEEEFDWEIMTLQERAEAIVVLREEAERKLQVRQDARR